MKCTLVYSEGNLLGIFTTQDFAIQSIRETHSTQKATFETERPDENEVMVCVVTENGEMYDYCIVTHEVYNRIEHL